MINEQTRKEEGHKELLRGQYARSVDTKATSDQTPSPSTTPQALFLLGLRLLTPQQRESLWKYLALTNYGTRYIPPEQQPEVLKLLTQLMEEEIPEELDFFAKLKRFQELRGSLLKDRGSYLALFQ